MRIYICARALYARFVARECAVTLATVVNASSTTVAALEMVKDREGIHEWADSRKFSLHILSFQRCCQVYFTYRLAAVFTRAIVGLMYIEE